ncbi:MAG: hypothetical protein WDN75_15495 [Bacteroidota bacterium]
MGDTGALMVGLILSYFSVRFINFNFLLPAGHIAKFNASISTAVCIMIIPVFDTLRIIILRLKNGQSPFRADRNHLHHRLLAFGPFACKRSEVDYGDQSFFYYPRPFAEISI